jgi:hypothetical protein
MKSANLLTIVMFVASLCATGSASAQDSRGVVLVQRDFSDCSNGDVSGQDPAIGGFITVDRSADGKTHVRVNLSARPNTTYHFFLKCVRQLGDITTQSTGFAVANFEFPTNNAGDVFAFDMYPEGAPSGNKFQSVQVNFQRAPADTPPLTILPPDQQVARQVALVPQDFSDCSNADVRMPDSFVRGGTVTIDRGTDGNTHVRAMLAAQPNSTYHFFLKCVRQIGDLRTQANGVGIANFDFPTNSAGDVFAFDVYPEGAPLGNKYQSVQVDFRLPPPPPVIEPPANNPPVTGPHILYVNEITGAVHFTYGDMPAGVEVILTDVTSGDDVGSAAALRQGDGTVDVPFTTSQVGRYVYLLARAQADKAYIARTIPFYIFGQPSSPPDGTQL